MILRDLRGEQKECVQKEIDGREFHICAKCWRPLLAIAERLLENQRRQSCVNGSFYYGGERGIRSMDWPLNRDNLLNRLTPR